MNSTRTPAVAGLFYPGDAAGLAASVRALLEAAPVAAGSRVPRALIAPHAGYPYSGALAARAYASLSAAAGRIQRVVLLGPVHRVPVRGLALPAATVFATPLGEIPLDTETMLALSGLPQVVTSAAAHAMEHSLEVHLPFLQSVLGDFRLLPLAVGDASTGEVEEVLERVWGGPETLVVISSDLSHFLSYHEAQRVDRETVQHILALRPDLDHHAACGATPVNGLLSFAGRHHLQPELIGQCNSGDTAGDRARVVGYVAIAFHEAPA